MLEEKQDRKDRVRHAPHHRHRGRSASRAPHAVHEREAPVRDAAVQSRVIARASSMGSAAPSSTSREKDDSDPYDCEYYVDVVEVYEVMAALKDKEALEEWEQKVQSGQYGRANSSPSALTDDVPEVRRGGAGGKHFGAGGDSPLSSSGSDDEAEEEERELWKRQRHRRRTNRRSYSHDKGAPTLLDKAGQHTQAHPHPSHQQDRASAKAVLSSTPPASASLSTPIAAASAQPETRNLLDTVSATFAALSSPQGLTPSPSHPQLASKRHSASLYPPAQPVHPSLSDTSLSSSLPAPAHQSPHPSAHTPQSAHHSSSLASPSTSSVPSRIERLSSTLTSHPTFIDEVTNLTILNEGVAGHAYRGSYHGLPVVVKLPKSLEISGQEWREWQAHLRLPAHRHLVHFLGALPMEENNYLVTALIKQGSLKGVLGGEGGRLYRQPYGVMRAALEIGRGLSHLHRHRIVHRDISSRNILVDSDGTFIVADLGLCREMGKAQEPSPEDSYEMARSTAIPVRWTAPEALLASVYTAKTDVWSLGVTLWEMATGGAVPYGAIEGNRKVIRDVVAGDARLTVDDAWGVGDGDGGLGARARRLVKRCLRREVEERPNSAELVELVEREMAEWEAAGGEEMERVKREWSEYHRALDDRLSREIREEEEERVVENSINGGRLVSVFEVSESRARAAEDEDAV